MMKKAGYMSGFISIFIRRHTIAIKAFSLLPYLDMVWSLRSSGFIPLHHHGYNPDTAGFHHACSRIMVCTFIFCGTTKLMASVAPSSMFSALLFSELGGCLGKKSSRK
jgi:hypothetical protein